MLNAAELIWPKTEVRIWPCAMPSDATQKERSCWIYWKVSSSQLIKLKLAGISGRGGTLVLIWLPSAGPRFMGLQQHLSLWSGESVWEVVQWMLTSSFSVCGLREAQKFTRKAFILFFSPLRTSSATSCIWLLIMLFLTVIYFNTDCTQQPVTETILRPLTMAFSFTWLKWDRLVLHWPLVSRWQLWLWLWFPSPTWNALLSKYLNLPELIMKQIFISKRRASYWGRFFKKKNIAKNQWWNRNELIASEGTEADSFQSKRTWAFFSWLCTLPVFFWI